MKTRFDLDDIYPGLERVETTTGYNGYPSNLHWAFYSDSRKEMEEVIENLRNDGHEVNELFLNKKNGHQLWNRDYRNHFSIDLTLSNDSDWSLSLDIDESIEDIKNWLELCLIGDDEEYREALGEEEIERMVNDFYSQISHYKGKGEIHVFYDGNNDNSVDYVVTDDSTGYHDGDVTTYQMAFEVIEKEEDDEEE